MELKTIVRQATNLMTMMEIQFYIYRYELLKALEHFAPFIIPEKKEDLHFRRYDDEEEGTISLPEPYFSDKVTFSFENKELFLSVLVDGVRITKRCDCTLDSESEPFCMPFAYLMQEVKKHDCDAYKFVEDRFFGFRVFDAAPESYLFEVEAFSVRKQQQIKASYPVLIQDFERRTLLKALNEFESYTNPYWKYETSIWFQIENGMCTVIATTGKTLRLEKIPTKVSGTYSFDIPGKYAKRFFNIIRRNNGFIGIDIAYNYKYCCIPHASMYGDNIEFPLNKEPLPNIQKLFEDKTIKHKATLLASDLLSVILRINTLKYKEKSVVLHFMKGHVNIYCEDIVGRESFYEYIDVEDCEGDFSVQVRLKSLENILQELTPFRISLYFVGNNLIYVVSELEELFGDIIRIITGGEPTEKYLEMLQRGDEALSKHQYYLERYYGSNEEKRPTLKKEMVCVSLYNMYPKVRIWALIPKFEWEKCNHTLEVIVNIIEKQVFEETYQESLADWENEFSRENWEDLKGTNPKFPEEAKKKLSQSFEFYDSKVNTIKKGQQMLLKALEFAKIIVEPATEEMEEMSYDELSDAEEILLRSVPEAE